MTCEHCGYAAKFHSYRRRRLVTVHGAVWVQRAYYYCGRCHQSFLPYDEALGLVDEVSPGLMPLVALAGTLLPFADAARDLLQRFAGVRLSASTVLRDTEGEGERLRAQQKAGRMVAPTQPEPHWTAAREGEQPAAYVGLDAFSVPMQGIGASQAEHRMLYTALLYTPGKEHTRYLVDFELDALAEQVRSQARALGVAQVSDLIAITDGGNGLEEALQRHLAENLTTILDWYHAAEHLCDFAKAWHGDDEAARTAMADAGQGHPLRARGRGVAELPAGVGVAGRRVGAGAGGVAQADRLLHEQPASHGLPDVPAQRLGHRQWPDGGGLQDHRGTLERIGHAWVEDGAVTVASLRALYVSGGKVWDGFWAQPRRRAA